MPSFPYDITPHPLRRSLCGYQIRFESKVSRVTRLTYCTTGVLLRQLISHPHLDHISHIIIDEVCSILLSLISYTCTVILSLTCVLLSYLLSLTCVQLSYLLSLTCVLLSYLLSLTCVQLSYLLYLTCVLLSYHLCYH